MLPEEGPLGGMGVVERMAAIDVVVDNVTEEVGTTGLAEELHALGGVPGHVVLVVQRTFYASGRPVEAADVVIPADRYRVAYHLPVK
ncbi:GntR family transcriptional regulator [Streptomyces hirsutus]